MIFTHNLTFCPRGKLIGCFRIPIMIEREKYYARTMMTKRSEVCSSKFAVHTQKQLALLLDPFLGQKCKMRVEGGTPITILALMCMLVLEYDNRFYELQDGHSTSQLSYRS